MVLSIAGSDPGGGAGVQADLKTCAVLGVYCGAAITCITVQNTRGVQSFVPLAPRLVKEQIDAVLNDMPVTHVKIGMVGTAAVAEAISDALAGFAGEIICDPVLVSSSGTALVAEAELDAVRENLLSRATVLTPNLPELEVLSRRRCQDEEALLAAAEVLFHAFSRLRALVVKGGHFAPRRKTVSDYLFLSQVHHGAKLLVDRARHPRIRTLNTHGTGCTFASAYAACHLKSGSDRLAFTQASEFVSQLLKKSAAARLGGGHGPLLHHLMAESWIRRTVPRLFRDTAHARFHPAAAVSNSEARYSAALAVHNFSAHQHPDPAAVRAYPGRAIGESPEIFVETGLADLKTAGAVIDSTAIPCGSNGRETVSCPLPHFLFLPASFSRSAIPGLYSFTSFCSQSR